MGGALVDSQQAPVAVRACVAGTQQLVDHVDAGRRGRALARRVAAIADDARFVAATRQTPARRHRCNNHRHIGVNAARVAGVATPPPISDLQGSSCVDDPPIF